MHIDELAKNIRTKRAGNGIRQAAKEAKVSPATLSRIENGKVPDLETFEKICSWLGHDPAKYLEGDHGIGKETFHAQVHFKKEQAIEQDSAESLSEMIMLAHKALLNSEEVQG